MSATSQASGMTAPALTNASPRALDPPLPPGAASPAPPLSTPPSSVAVAAAADPAPPEPRPQASVPPLRRRNTLSGYPTWSAHRSALKMLQDEAKVLSWMRPSPAPPKEDMHQVQYDPAHVESMPLRHSSHSPPVSRSAHAGAGSGPSKSHQDLVHNLAVLAEQGRPDPSAQQRSWRGIVFPDAGPSPAPDPCPTAASPTQSKTSPRPIPPLARSYTEGCVGLPSPPHSPWSKIRQRFGSFSQSHIPEDREEESHFTGSGWSGHRCRASSANDSGFSSGGSHMSPRERRRSLFEAPSSFPLPSKRPGSTRMHRQATLPITGAPGFSPREHSTFGGAAAATWAAEELARGAERKRGIPVKLVGRRLDERAADADQPASNSGNDVGINGAVSPSLAAHLQARLPHRLRLRTKWQLVYSLDQHGVSLKTMYALTNKFFDRPHVQNSSEHAPSPFALLDKELSSKLNMPGSSTTSPSDPEASPPGRPPQPKRHATVPDYPTASRPKHQAGHASASHSHRHHHLGAMADQTGAGLVLAIRDMEGNVFGAFLSSRLRISSHYYGSGESFLWKTVTSTRDSVPPNAGEEGKPEDRLVVYPWTGQNDFIVLSEAHFLSVGFGSSQKSQGGYGLWVDEEFARGSSARCATFDNDILCSPQVPTGPTRPGGREEEYFECFQVELWAVGLSS